MQHKFEAVSDDKKEKAFSDALGLDFLVQTDEKSNENDKENEDLGVDLVQLDSTLKQSLKSHIK